MIRLQDVSYVRLGTADLEGATAFATEYLGLEIAYQSKDSVYLKSDQREHTLCYFAGAPTDQTAAFEIEIRVAEKTSPNEKSPVTPFGGPACVQNAPNRSKAPRIYPRRLAHMLCFTRDIPKKIAFFHDVLGLRLSDRSGDFVAFMHGIHGSDHHMIAFVKSEGSGLDRKSVV